jgi:hypothetical protein
MQSAKAAAGYLGNARPCQKTILGFEENGCEEMPRRNMIMKGAETESITPHGRPPGRKDRSDSQWRAKAYG